MKPKKVCLKLDDGSFYEGFSFGFEKSVSGEVVFNTGMVGYPESFTDPSYKGQILVLTYPLIGNYGVPKKEIVDEIIQNWESKQVQISALIVSTYAKEPSHWNSSMNLSEWLISQRIPAIYGIDTRKLTKKLRENGTMLGKIIFDEEIDFFDTNKINLVNEVSIKEPKIYGNHDLKVILVDCGCKESIIKNLVDQGLQVIRVPWDYDFSNLDFDGVFISNGPGDPKMCEITVRHIKMAMEKNIPIFGICFGNQILALASGGDTYKLKYGHRSQNQPCLEVGTKRCYITSQNHGFAVKKESLLSDWEEWFININDGTNEGIKHKEKPFMSVQFHPEANPGPVDTSFLFKKFYDLVKSYNNLIKNYNIIK
jgi:carbamoyl-phosphate synthase small subunit